MPLLTRVGVRLAFGYFLASTLVGALEITRRTLGWPGVTGSLVDHHVEWMAVGFMLQFTMSIAYWILPKFGSRRGREELAAAALVLLNLGLVLDWILGLAAGRILEAGACLLFLVHAWPRVKPPMPYGQA